MRVLITGITGFAGSHLADYLLAEHPDVEVFGIHRWRSRMENVDHLEGKVRFIEGDLRDFSSVHSSLAEARPDAIFHLAAQSYVPTSWRAPVETLTTNLTGRPSGTWAWTRRSRSPAPARSTVWSCPTRHPSPRTIPCGRCPRTRSPRWVRICWPTSTTRATA